MLILLAALAVAALIVAVYVMYGTAGLVILTIAVGVLNALRWMFLPTRRLPANRVRHMHLRLKLRLHPGRGHATALETWLRWGRVAAFRKSRFVRPSLTAWQRLTQPAEHSIFLGRGHYRLGLRLPLEEHVLLMAPPRTGKTGMIASFILRYPGPCVSTTTKADVFRHTWKIRARNGRPIHVFNPQNVGGVLSTFRWDPISGCTDPAVAIRRADGFANAIDMASGDNAFFQNMARAYARALMHAAALIGGADMRHVSQWALTGTKGGAIEAENVLRQNGAGTWADELAQLHGAAEKTNATNEMVLSQMFGFMADRALAASVLPAEGAGIDFGEFLRQRGTLYMVADSDREESPLAPLFACMASEIHYTAAMAGSRMDGGRLDPPVLFALDEVCQICPVPVPTWMSDAGGKGIQVCAVTHGEAQLRSRWGKDGAQVIMDTASVKVFLPGITDVSTLKAASDLCEEAAYREHGQGHRSRHPVMSPGMIRQLPARRGLVLRSSLSPVVALLPLVWKDGIYRAQERHGAAVAPLVPAAPPRPLAPLARMPELEITTEAVPDAELLPDEMDDGDSPWYREETP